ncbi:MAG: hypothetical protein Q8P59_01905 [Dehalococcoidia bacterium]|nr:hypothetical protein [Dehalococcoidia bacterium]
MENLHIQLNGLSPLLMNNPAGSMTRPTGGQVLGRKNIPTPEAEAKASRYVLPDGNLFMLAVAVRNCLLTATKGQLINRKSALPFVSGGILMIAEAFPLYRKGKPIKGDDYSVFTCRAVVQRQGIMRSRARVELPWQLDCIFQYNKDIISLDVIRAIAERAGQIVGIGDYRVEKKGWSGRFEVTKVFTEG